MHRKEVSRIFQAKCPSDSYTTPLRLKAGSTASLTCTFDNSENDPHDASNPLVPVSWGATWPSVRPGVH